MIIFLLSDKPLDEDLLRESLQDDGSGCAVVFAGHVRDDDEGRGVSALEYEAYPALCQAEGEALAAEAERMFDVRRVVLAHRRGRLEVGQTAVWIGVAAAHRDAAFRACRHLIEEVKHSLPVWKKQVYSDGRTEWLRPPAPEFDAAEYGLRQREVPEVGAEGEKALREASVLAIGAGGLGAPALRLLAGAGVGRIGICDPDVVSLRDLHRQTLYDVDDVGEAKAEIAAARLGRVNPSVEVVPRRERLDAANAAELLRGWSLVLDCADNLPTKYLLNDAAHLLGVPVIHAAVHHWEGQVMLIDPADDRAGCLRCMRPRIPAGDHGPAGAMGPVTAVMGGVLSTLAVRRLIGRGPAAGRMRLLDLRRWGADELAVPRDPACPLCGESPAITGFDPGNYVVGS